MGFFSSLQNEGCRLVVVVQYTTTSVSIQSELGFGQMEMRGHESVRRFHAGFFVSAERDNQIPCRCKALCLQSQEGRRQNSRAEFIVVCASAEKVAIFFDQRKWITVPVFWKCIDNRVLEALLRMHQWVLVAI